VADAVEAWALANAHLRVAVCGHLNDYPSLESYTLVPWTRKRLTYSGSDTTDQEGIWFSPACLAVTVPKQMGLFA
jgi:hypothetical protein